MEEQLELFEIETGLSGEKAWIVAKKVWLGEITYERACIMVANQSELDDDLIYLNSICF